MNPEAGTSPIGGQPEQVDSRRASTSSFARATGYVLSPLTLPPLLTAFVLAFFCAPLPEIASVTGTVACLLTVTPAALLIWMVRRGSTATLEMPEREARRVMFVAALAAGSAALLAIQPFSKTATPVLVVLLVAYLLNVAILMIVNISWKISLHAAAAAGAGVAVLYVASHEWDVPHADVGLSMLAGVSILLAAIVGWARIRRQVHTLSQVCGGWFVGALATFVELAAADHLGLLTLT